MASRLIVISGLPGVGKTSVAAAAADRMHAVHLSIDAIEESLLASGLPPSWEVGVAAYEAARTIAELNLGLQHDVVVDAVNDSDEARQTWRNAALAGHAELVFVQLVTSDPQKHQRRLEARDRGFEHVREPAWQQVLRRAAEYPPWTDAHAEFDTTALSVGDIAAAVVSLASSRTTRQSGAMTNPTAAMLVIGDEILSGRTREANAYHLAGRLGKVGIDLREIRVVPDDHAVIVDALRALRAAHDQVFTSGGIGPTHDDITADAVGDAFGVGVEVRDDARALLQDAVGRGRTLTDEHLRMARIPHGAALIVNTVSGAPGFTIGNVHVMAGVPTIFVAMLDAVLPSLDAGLPMLSGELRFEVGEGRIAAPLRALAAEMTDLSIGSYPFQDASVYGTNIVVRGTDSALIDKALTRLEEIRRSHG